MGLNEKCGIVGIYSHEPDISRSVYFGLWALQHRGQESSGIASSNGKTIFCHKGQGLVAHVYSEVDLRQLKGNIAIGQNRYATSGGSEIYHAQPVHHRQYPLALVHNGNLPQVTELKKFLISKGISLADLNDSELMHKVIEYWLVKGKPVEKAIRLSFPLFTGAFCLLIMTKHALVALRDPCGIRPLCLGKSNGSYVFASETCALEAIGAKYVRDVNPGEMIIIDAKGMRSVQLASAKMKLDIFEYIYFARPDSVLIGKSVYEVRKKLGRELAKEVHLKADVVIPVPDSAVPCAIGFAQAAKIKFEQALTKNRYIHRTFIKPAQKQRATGVRMKLSIIKEIVENKRVVLVDDSIVRGTTSKMLVKLVRRANPKEVHVLISCPPVKYPDFYGIDTPDQDELISSTMSVEQLRRFIGADSLHFLSLEGTLKAIGVGRSQLCLSCFTGEYPIDIGRKQNEITFIK